MKRRRRLEEDDPCGAAAESAARHCRAAPATRPPRQGASATTTETEIATDGQTRAPTASAGGTSDTTRSRRDERCVLTQLPPEMLLHVVRFLGTADVARASAFCRPLLDAAASELRAEREARDTLAQLCDETDPRHRATLTAPAAAADACWRLGLSAARPFGELARRAARRLDVDISRLNSYVYTTHPCHALFLPESDLVGRPAENRFLTERDAPARTCLASPYRRRLPVVMPGETVCLRIESGAVTQLVWVTDVEFASILVETTTENQLLLYVPVDRISAGTVLLVVLAPCDDADAAALHPDAPVSDGEFAEACARHAARACSAWRTPPGSVRQRIKTAKRRVRWSFSDAA